MASRPKFLAMGNHLEHFSLFHSLKSSLASYSSFNLFLTFRCTAVEIQLWHADGHWENFCMQRIFKVLHHTPPKLNAKLIRFGPLRNENPVFFGDFFLFFFKLFPKILKMACENPKNPKIRKWHADKIRHPWDLYSRALRMSEHYYVILSICQNATFQLRYQNESCSKCHKDVRQSLCHYVKTSICQFFNMSVCRNATFQLRYQNESCSECHHDVR